MKVKYREELSVPKFLHNGGEMGRIVNNMDWAKHPLGEPIMWPLSLRMAVSSMLKNAFPNFILWGKEYFCFYNDAYRPSLGKDGKHPFIVGQRFEDAFPELVDTLKKEADKVWQTGKATWHENKLVSIYRNGKMEEVYWTFSYSVLNGDEEETDGILITCIETTDAVLNLKKLKESENQLAFAVDAAELGTWDYNPITDAFQGNDRLMDWLGMPHGESIKLERFLGASILKDLDRVRNAIEKALNGQDGGKYAVIYSIVNTETKEIKIVRALGRARFNQSKGAYRFSGTLQDVSEQVHFEKKLQLANAQIKKEEQRFRNIVFKAPVGIAIFKGKDLVTEMANNELLKLVDRDADNFVGKKLFDAMPEVRATVAHLFEAVYHRKESIRGTDLKVNIERNGEMKDAYFNFIIHPITFDKGEVVEVMLVTNEVTEFIEAKEILAENENQFRKHVLHSPIAMTILRGIDLKIEMANIRMLTHFWGRSWDEVKGKNLLTVFPELKDQKSLAELHNVLATGQAVRAKASRFLISIDGKDLEFYVDYHYIPLTEADGSISGVIATATDVTEQVLSRKKLENFSKDLEKQVEIRTNLLQNANEKLQDSIAKLENANEELQSFAYVSSHDLQEPLRKIQMYNSLIMEKELGRFTEKGKFYFEKMTFAAGRMRTLIDDLLSFSRSDNDIAKYETIDLNDVLDQVLDDANGLIVQSHAKISIKKLPEIEAILFQMVQVFSNLISNAIKFAKHGVPPEITISSTVASANQIQHLKLNHNKKYYAISVSDNGIGLPKGVEGKIFEVFQRLHGRHEYEGTGIGLAIVKKIISNHRGSIKTESVEGEGSTFTIFLPEKYT